MTTKTVLLLLGIMAGTIGISSASQITLDPSSLPSDQGWDYIPTGLHAGTVETDIFSTDGSVLNMSSVGQPYGQSGATLVCRQYDVVSSATPTIFEWTSRTLDYEQVSHSHQNFGFVVSFSVDSLVYATGIGLNQISLFDGSGFENIAVDTTEYHTYRMETDGTSSYDFYVDNLLRASVSARYRSDPNNVSFGDGTGTANATVDISSLQFSQIPEPATMGLIGIFAGGVIFVRRFFIS